MTKEGITIETNISGYFIEPPKYKEGQLVLLPKIPDSPIHYIIKYSYLYNHEYLVLNTKTLSQSWEEEEELILIKQ